MASTPTPTIPTFSSVKGPAIDLEAHGSSRLSRGTEIPPPTYNISRNYAFADSKFAVSGRQSPPAYDSEEPDTLARYYFKFGFLCPLLWLAGAWILRSPLTIDSSLEWLPEKTEGERNMIHQRYRDFELRWARRCLWAFITFLIITIIVVAIILGVVLRRQ